jgi:hypothetical protein
MKEREMKASDNILNLLVDPQSGNIRHATLAHTDCCGYRVEQLKGMNIGQLFLQPLDGIIEKISHSEYLKVISLPLCAASGETVNAKVYASFMTIENQPMLFLCVYELEQQHLDCRPLPAHEGLAPLYAC